MRKHLRSKKKEKKDHIRWRGHEVTRIEAFSDAVFAFAVTLLIVSLEVPKNFDELLVSLESFFPFAICFAILFEVWVTQNTFFRRYGLHDEWTLALNGMLLFFVLFFVYPLKFMFSAIFLHTYTIEFERMATLYYVYSGGFTMIYLLFTLMYYHAWRQREDLELTDIEAFETITHVYRNLGLVFIGLLSVIMAWAGFLNTAWLPYALIGVVIGMTHRKRGKLSGKRFPKDTVIKEVVQNDDVKLS